MRKVLSSLGVLALLIAVSSDARAHGGNFRLGNPNPGPPTQGPPAPPGLPGGPGTVTRPGRRIPNEALGYGTADWVTWWQLNAEAWDRPRAPRNLPGRIAVTPSEGTSGPTESDGATEEERSKLAHRRLLTRAYREDVLPLFRRLTSPQSEAAPQTVAAALIAWARTSADPEVIQVLTRHAANRTAHREVRESAVFGLGLLRRSDAEARLDVATLDDVREGLLQIFDDDKNPDRMRAWAIYALGFLSDQPRGGSSLQASGCLITRALWHRLQRTYAGVDLPASLLLTLGMQPPTSVPDGVKAQLRRLVFKGRQSWAETLRSHALQAYVRLLAADRVHVIQAVVTRNPTPGHDQVQAAAFTALAETAPTLDSPARRDAAAWLLETLPRIQEPRAAGLGILALGALLGADLQAGSTLVLEETKTASFLLRTAPKGNRDQRPYAALALATVAGAALPPSRPGAMFQAKVKKALAEGVRLAGGTDEARAPYVTAAGIGRAEAARPYLLKILANKHRQPFIRGHAARALGVLGRHDDKAFELLIEATRDRVHPLVHAQAARALGMLGAPGACEELLLQLHREGVTRGAAVAVTLALGRVGDFRAVYRLVRLAEEESAGVYVRTMAVVALGLIYDPETPPSRALLRTNANYMNMTWSLRSILDIL